MSRRRQIQTSFTAGELAPELYGRRDIAAYQQGAAELTNVRVLITGGVTRRAGSRHVDALPGPARLIAADLRAGGGGPEDPALVVCGDGWIRIYRGDTQVASLSSPFTLDSLDRLAWTQDRDSLYVCEPFVAPQRLFRDEAGLWQITPLVFDTIDGLTRQPFHKFADSAVTVTPSGLSGTITLTASAPVFQAAHVGQAFEIAGRQVTLQGVTDPTQASAVTREDLIDTGPTRDWQEPALSDHRGWPRSLTFHQGRLVIGGSRDAPERLWLSRSGRPFDFDTDQGDDDDAISLGLVSDTAAAIQAVFSARSLQVFTTRGTWQIEGDPITPGRLGVRQHARTGCRAAPRVPVVDVDGATVFVEAGARSLREFTYDEASDGYITADLGVRAPHLVGGVRDLAFDDRARLLYGARDDGTVVSAALDADSRVLAYSRLVSDGTVGALAQVADSLWWQINRSGQWRLERLESALSLDSALTRLLDPAGTMITGLGHLEGRAVRVLADGRDAGTHTVNAGTITLDRPAAAVTVGLSYAHRIAPLPPAVGSPLGGEAAALRLVALTLRLQETALLRLDTGQGPRLVPLRRLGAEGVLDTPPRPISGDVKLRRLGWHRQPARALWRIDQDDPFPCTLLSVSTEVAAND